MKELIIIVYKLNCDNISRQAFEEQTSILSNNSLSMDKELQYNNYLIREIFLPVEGIPSDIKVVYPTPYSDKSEISELIEELSNKIENEPTFDLKNDYIRLIRNLKLRLLNE